MANTLTITRYYWKDDVRFDPNSVTLSDSTGTFGVKRNDTDAVVVADGTAMTKVSTGVYRHTFTEPATDLTYTIALEVVAQSGDEADFFESVETGVASAAAAANVWTPTTLATDLMGLLNRSPNATGGSVSARLLRIVTDAYEDLWEMHEWQFRKVLATLTTVADTATADLPADFEKLDQDWLHENNDRGPLLFTANQQRFEDWRYLNGDQGDVPTIAFIKAKTSLTTSYLSEVLFTPTPNAEYTYPYFYLRFAPTLAATSSPVWPRVFNRGWKYLATSRARKSMEAGKAWEADEAIWQDWLANAKVNNNEVKSSNTAVIGDGYGDLARTASTLYQWGGGARCIAG